MQCDPIDLQPLIRNFIHADLASTEEDEERQRRDIMDAIESIKLLPTSVYVGHVSVVSENIEPILRVMATAVDYSRLSTVQKSLIVSLWNFFRREMKRHLLHEFEQSPSTAAAHDLHRQTSAIELDNGSSNEDFLGLTSLEMLYDYILPGAMDSTKGRLAMRWLKQSADSSQLQQLVRSIDTLIEGVHHRLSPAELQSQYSGYQTIRLSSLNGWTLLHLVASQRHLSSEKYIKDLVHAGMDANAKDSTGHTPLHVAALHFNWTAVNVLTTLSPASKMIPNALGDIAVVHLLRHMDITNWRLFITLDRVSSLISMLTPPSYLDSLWASAEPHLIFPMLIHGPSDLASQLIGMAQTLKSWNVFRKILSCLVKCIERRRNTTAIALLSTLWEFLHHSADSWTKDSEMDCASIRHILIDVCMAVAVLFRNLDVCIELISKMNSLLEISFLPYVFPLVLISLEDGETLKVILEKFSNSLYAQIFLHGEQVDQNIPSTVSQTAIQLYRSYLCKTFNQRDFDRWIYNHAYLQSSVLEMVACIGSSHVVSVFLKRTQKVFRDSDVPFSIEPLLQRCLKGAIRHRNWRSIDLLWVLDSALLKAPNTGLSLDRNAIEATCRILTACIKAGHGMDAEAYQVCSRIVPRFTQYRGQPITFVSSWKRERYTIVKQIQTDLRVVIKRIEHLASPMKVISRGGVTPEFWKSLLSDKVYGQTRQFCIDMQDKYESTLRGLQSVAHAAAVRRLCRNFSPDAKWMKLAYFVLLYLNCLDGKVDRSYYMSVTEKHWSHFERVISQAIRSKETLQAWCLKFSSGIDIFKYAEEGSLNVDTAEDFAFFLSKLRDSALKVSAPRTVKSKSPDDPPFVPSMEELKALRRTDSETGLLYEQYDFVLRQFAEVGQFLTKSMAASTSEPFSHEELSQRNLISLLHYDREYDRLSHLLAQLECHFSSTPQAEGDYLGLLLFNSSGDQSVEAMGTSQVELNVMDFVKSLRFTMGEDFTVPKSKRTTKLHNLHPHLLDEVLVLIVQACSCKEDELLVYLVPLVERGFYQAAMAIIDRYHKERLRFAFDDWNVLHAIYKCADGSIESGIRSRTLPLSLSSPRPDQVCIVSPLHYAIRDGHQAFIEKFFDAFPNYPVDLMSLQTYVAESRLYRQWTTFVSAATKIFSFKTFSPLTNTIFPPQWRIDRCNVDQHYSFFKHNCLAMMAFNHIPQRLSSPAQPCTHITRTAATHDHIGLRLVAMMDGTWLSMEEVVSNYNNFARALPTPTSLIGQGSLCHLLIARLCETLSNDCFGLDVLDSYINRVPNLVPCAFLPMSNHSPSPFFRLLEQHKYVLAWHIWQMGNQASNNLHDGDLENDSVIDLKQIVLNKHEIELRTLNETFLGTVPSQKPNKTMLRLIDYLQTKRDSSALTHCAACLSYCEAAWMQLTDSPKAAIFVQQTSRSDLMRIDCIIRARQVLSILQITYNQLFDGAHQPDFVHLSPSFLCRRVTASMYRQLKLLVVGWLHPKLTGGSIQIHDHQLIFHNARFSCLNYLPDELRSYKSASILNKENFINFYLQTTEGKNGRTLGGLSVPSVIHSKAEDVHALDSISYACLVLEYARSVCLARASCIVSYQEDVSNIIASSYAMHPLSVIRRDIFRLTSSIHRLQTKSDTQSRGLSARISLIDHITSSDVLLLLNFSATYSKRLKRLREIIVASLQAILADLGKANHGKILKRLESNRTVGIGNDDHHAAANPDTSYPTHESDMAVIKNDILPRLCSLKIADFWRTGKFPVFRKAFESFEIAERDVMIDVVQTLKKGNFVEVTEEEEANIYFAFQSQAKIMHNIATGDSPEHRLYSKSAMETVAKLQRCLQLASELYWFVSSCYGLIQESVTSTIYDNDVSIILSPEIHRHPLLALIKGRETKFDESNCLRINLVKGTVSADAAAAGFLKVQYKGLCVLDIAALNGDVVVVEAIMTNARTEDLVLLPSFSHLVWRILFCAEPGSKRYEKCIRLLLQRHFPVLAPTTESLSCIDLACIKQMPDLVCDLLDLTIAQVSQMASSSSSDLITMQERLQWKFHSSLAGLVAIAMQLDSKEEQLSDSSRRAYKAVLTSLRTAMMTKSFSVSNVLLNFDQKLKTDITKFNKYMCDFQPPSAHSWSELLCERFVTSWQIMQHERRYLQGSLVIKDVEHFSKKFLEWKDLSFGKQDTQDTNSYYREIRRRIEAVPESGPKEWTLLDLAVVANDDTLFEKQLAVGQATSLSMEEQCELLRVIANLHRKEMAEMLLQANGKALLLENGIRFQSSILQELLEQRQTERGQDIIRVLVAHGCRLPMDDFIATVVGGKAGDAYLAVLLASLLVEATPVCQEEYVEHLCSWRSAQEETLLHIIARRGLTRLASVYIRQVSGDVETTDAFGYTALQCAIATGHAEVTKAMRAVCPEYIRNALERVVYALQEHRLKCVIERSQEFLRLKDAGK